MLRTLFFAVVLVFSLPVSAPRSLGKSLVSLAARVASTQVNNRRLSAEGQTFVVVDKGCVSNKRSALPAFIICPRKGDNIHDADELDSRERDFFVVDF